MVFVFGLVLIDVTILIIYTALEGAIAHFRAGIVVNKEKPMALEGVSMIFCITVTVRALLIIVLSLKTIGLGNSN